MIVDLSFPCTVRAKPPRCTFTKQVLCTMRLLVNVQEITNPDNFRTVARTRDARGIVEDIRHDGGNFYRPICSLSTLVSGEYFAAWMKAENYLRNTYMNLMEDERRSSLEFNELNWPPKDRSKRRRDVSYEEAMTFDELDMEDASRCESEVARLISTLVVFEETLWIQCGEPCYRIGKDRHGKTKGHPSFSDQQVTPAIDVAFLSALDHDVFRSDLARVQGTEEGAIDIIDTDVFEIDFDDMNYIKYTYFVVAGIAGYLARDGHFETGTALLESSLEDVDIWNCARRMLKEMLVQGTSAGVDDELIAKAAEIWKRMNGKSYDGPRFMGSSDRQKRFMLGEEFDRWFSDGVGRWLDRPVKLEVRGGGSFSNDAKMG